MGVWYDKLFSPKVHISGCINAHACSCEHIYMNMYVYKSWRQHPTRHQLYGHLPPITKAIQVRRTRHAGHCWRSTDELISDVLLWTHTHGRAKAGRPAWTYIQQLCEDTGCCPEDLPETMNDREKWRERVRDIRATSTTWWWWYVFTQPLRTRSIFLAEFNRFEFSALLLGQLPYQV